VRVLITGNDVIHSWSVPAFGIKLDAIPGRVNETWFKATEIGTYRGQCSQLCGVWHGFMPIVVKVVSQDDFNAWVAQEQKAQNITPPQAAGEAQPAAAAEPAPAKKVPAGASATTKKAPAEDKK
jgi:cytochrome c oxidase subunit 2